MPFVSIRLAEKTISGMMRHEMSRLALLFLVSLCWDFCLIGQVLPPMTAEQIPNLAIRGRACDIYQDETGLLWFAYSSSGKGLCTYDGVEVSLLSSVVSDTFGLCDDNIHTIRRAPDGKIWLGTATQGLCIYDPSTDRFTQLDIAAETGSAVRMVREIVFDDAGDAWLACNGGLVRVRDDSCTLFRAEFPYASAEYLRDCNALHYLIHDPYRPQTLLLASLLGLISFDITSESFTHYKMPFGGNTQTHFLPTTQYLVTEIVCLDSTRIACGTWGGGMLIYDRVQRKWHQYRDPDVILEDDVYYDIEFRDANSLWVCSRRGFGVFSCTEGSFSYYDTIPYSGYAYRNCKDVYAMEILDDGAIVLNGSLGACIAHITDVPLTQSMFPPHIQSISVDGMERSRYHLTYVDHSVTLPENANALTVRIVAPCYSGRSAIHYRYQLIGRDRTWKTLLGSGVVSYTDLPEGNFALEYQASMDGVSWVDGESWTVSRDVPFWRSSLFRGIGITLILGLVLLYFIVVSTQRRKRRVLEQQYQHLLAESEMAALRAQMNPHFIFNSLNSIKMHVMKQDTAVANKYLARFAQLMRLVLRNSQSRLISLAVELQALELYVDIEKLRFDQGFTSNIIVNEEIDPENCFIPPMLVQPYVENAIWHGLMHKKTPGHLDIEVQKLEDRITIVVTDDGIGREKSAAFQSKSLLKKSYGTKITADRIDLIRKSLQIDASVQFQDLQADDGTPSGTRVILSLPYLDTKQASQWLNAKKTESP